MPNSVKKGQNGEGSGTLMGVNSDLPFMTKDENGWSSFWNVYPSGDWGADCKMGRSFAKALLTFIKDRDRASLAPRVMAAAGMIRAIPTGIEIGFFMEITECAQRGLR